MRNVIFKLFLSSLLFILLFLSCDENPVLPPDDNHLPNSSHIEITWEKVPYNKTDIWNSSGAVPKVFINSENKLFISGRVSVDSGKTWETSGHSISYMDYYDNLFYTRFWEGIYKSTDDGVSWNQITDYYTTSDRDIFNNSNNKLFKVSIDCDLCEETKLSLYSTTNNGASWKWLFRGDGYYLDHNDQLYGWVENRLYTSKDDGENWELLYTCKENIKDVQKDRNGILYMATNVLYKRDSAYFYESVDNGKSWKQIPVTFQNFTFSVTSDNRVFAVTNDVIYRYNMSDKQFYELLKAPADNFRYARINSLYPKIFISTHENGLIFSENWGETWSSTSFSMPNVYALSMGADNRILTDSYYIDKGYWHKNVGGYEYAESIVINSKGKIFMPSSWGILASSDNGETYREFSISQAGPQVEDLVISNTDELYLAFSHNNLYKSDPSGLNWSKIFNTRDMWAFDLFIKEGIIYFGTELGLLISYDSGTSWDTTHLNQEVKSVALDAEGTIYTASNNGVNTSNDGGKTWQEQPYNFRILEGNELGDIIIGINAAGCSYYKTLGISEWQEIELARNMKVTAVYFNDENNKILLGTRNSGILLGNITRR